MRHVRQIVTGMLTLIVCLVMCTTRARADESTVILDYRPTANPVADRTVHIDVNKLDKDTHEYVVGAHLQIIDKETGKVMADWVSDKTTQESARELDIDVVYILHEVEAPKGYEKADDVEFILRSVNFETKGEVLSGAQTADGEANAEFNNVSGDIETQAFVISLYDKASSTENTVTEYRDRESKEETSKKEEKKTQNEESQETTHGSGTLTKTGDDTTYAPMVVLILAGAALIGFALYRRRQK